MSSFINFLHYWTVLLIRILVKLYNGAHGPAQPAIKDPLLMESATSLAQKIRTKEITSVEVVQAFINRIIEINPLLNCVIDERYEDALEDAAAVDKYIESGQLSEQELAKQKPFLGVPISTKDALMVKDMLNTAGVYSRKNLKSDADCEAMALMRKSGAIPFAITNVSESCMWWESVNTLYGRTRNPYDTNRIVGGSSGGEGCLLSAGGSPFGLGSDMGGSSRMPAFFNGIFGHKPSQHIVPNTGHYPDIHEDIIEYLCIGPMCRYAADLKPVLQILANDNLEHLRLDEPVDLRALKVYYQEDDGSDDLISKVDPDIKESLMKAVDHFRDNLGAEVRKIQVEKFKESVNIWMMNMKYTGSERELTSRTNIRGCYSILKEFIRWLFGRSHHTIITIFTIIMEHLDNVDYGHPKHMNMVQMREDLSTEMKEILGDNGILLYPTHPTVAPYHGEPILRAMNFAYSAIFNVLGLPATSVPMGLGSEGLPVGVQVIAGVNQDRLCFAVATELEKAFGGWVSSPQTII